jgi:membrane-bound lytic murein transglycosylase A
MKYKKIHNILLVLALSGTMVWNAGCARLSQRLKPSSKTVLEKVHPSAYPGFDDDMDFDGLEHGVVQSLAYFNRVPQTRMFKFGKDLFDARHMIQTLEHFLTFIRTRPDTRHLRQYVADNYWVYRSVGGKKSGRVLFTGYFEPLLYGLNEKSPEYRYPVYARPEDIVSIDLSQFSKKYKGNTIVGRVTNHKVIPYYDRKAIDSRGALDGTVKALAWVNNPVDPFFLQIQGSGKIYLDTGEVLNVHYHMTNGHPYRSIGKLLINENKIPREKMSMQSIRSYLNEHPDEIEETWIDEFFPMGPWGL